MPWSRLSPDSNILHPGKNTARVQEDWEQGRETLAGEYQADDVQWEWSGSRIGNLSSRIRKELCNSANMFCLSTTGAVVQTVDHVTHTSPELKCSLTSDYLQNILLFSKTAFATQARTCLRSQSLLPYWLASKVLDPLSIIIQPLRLINRALGREAVSVCRQ